MKDKKWAQREVDRYLSYEGVVEARNALVFAKGVINQLDEPEKVVIPKYVADWIEQEGSTMSNWKLPNRFISDSKYRKGQRHKWSQVEGNMDKFMSALINGYEVEKEPLYYALIKGNENIDSDDKYWNCCITDKSLSIGDNKVHLDVSDAYLLKATQYQWENLGINDTNADFIPVEEEEE